MIRENGDFDARKVCAGRAKGLVTLIVSSTRYSTIILLVFLTFPLILQAQPNVAPTNEFDLHTHAEWRVNAQVKFDAAGRLVLLYRDKFKLNPKGNWHLVRLAGPFTRDVRRERVDFSIPQEPVDPDSARRWDSFSSSLLLTADGSRAYATFQGTVVTVKPGPPPPGAVRNVSVETFSSVVSFDLAAFRLLAVSDIAGQPSSPAGQQVSVSGDLALLYWRDTDWKLSIHDEFLSELRAITISAVPIAKAERHSCYLRPDLQIECPMEGKGDVVLGHESVVQLPPSTCKMTQGAGAFGIGKDEVLRDRVLQSDRLCTRDKSGNEELVSADLLPRCRRGWDVSAISPDNHSVLTSCILMDIFLDTFSYISRASLQLIDGHTLAVKATIPLSTHRRSTFAVFHHSGESTIAVIEDGTKLLLYAVEN